MAATPYPAWEGVLFVGPVREAPSGKMPDGGHGWGLFVVCRPDKRSAIGQGLHRLHRDAQRGQCLACGAQHQLALLNG